MASGTYDIITVGGGLGGSALALAMAEHGARVLVLERESHFRDRVRGEGMHAWGVPEARALGCTSGCARRVGRSALVGYLPASRPDRSPRLSGDHAAPLPLVRLLSSGDARGTPHCSDPGRGRGAPGDERAGGEARRSALRGTRTRGPCRGGARASGRRGRWPQLAGTDRSGLPRAARPRVAPVCGGVVGK